MPKNPTYVGKTVQEGGVEGNGYFVATSSGETQVINENGEVVTTGLANGAVTVAKLETALQPSHVVKYAGVANNGGGSATVALTVTGVAATDVVLAQVQASTNAVTVQKVVPTTNTITLTLSGDPGASTKIAYQVLRAVS